MCGIVGFTHKHRAPDSDRIRRAVATLLHRGPDQQGVFESSLLSMGATRLKIIDLGSGDQPILSEDGNVAIVFNGEVYNHQELRRELQELGHRFIHTATRKLFFERSWNGTRIVSHACAACSQSRSGQNRRSDWSWRVIVWGSSPFISRGAETICFRL